MSLELSPKRIVTHTDLDGVACGALLSFIFGIDEIAFVEPSEIQNGSFMTEPTDIVSDLPHPPEGCLIWFDHHSQLNPPEGPDLYLDTSQPSCAGYIYRTYKDQYDLSHFEKLIERVDAIDSARYTKENIMNPDAAEQISTSLKKIREDDEFLQEIVSLLKSLPVEKVAEHPLVQKNFREIQEEQNSFMEHERENFVVDENLVILDTRGRERVPGFNPFLAYLEFPDCEWLISIRHNDSDTSITRFAAFDNIWLNTKPKAHAGKILAKYGGGGHKGAAGASLPTETAEEAIKEILSQLKER